LRKKIENSLDFLEEIVGRNMDAEIASGEVQKK
jgi:hypothetical protein